MVLNLYRNWSVFSNIMVLKFFSYTDSRDCERYISSIIPLYQYINNLHLFMGTRYNISLSGVFSWYSTNNWRFNWNIVASGIKYHEPTQKHIWNSQIQFASIQNVDTIGNITRQQNNYQNSRTGTTIYFTKDSISLVNYPRLKMEAVCIFPRNNWPLTTNIGS